MPVKINQLADTLPPTDQSLWERWYERLYNNNKDKPSTDAKALHSFLLTEAKTNSFDLVIDSLKIPANSILSESQENLLDGDLRIIVAFFLLKKNSTTALPHLENLWPEDIKIDALARYQNILTCLSAIELNRLIPSESKPVSLALIERQLAQLEACVKFSLANTVAENPSWRTTMTHWLIRIAETVVDCFKTSKPRDERMEEVSLRLRQLTNQLSIPLEEQQFLQNFYQNGIQIYKKQQNKEPIEINCPWYRHFRWQSKQDYFLEKISSELNTIERMGKFSYKKVLIEREQTGRLSLDDYLATYQEMNQALKTLSINAWEMRVNLEQSYRSSLTDKSYLEQVERLDRKLLELHNRMEQMNSNWFRSNEALSDQYGEDKALHEANQMLENLESPLLKSWRVNSWASHTCYDQLAEKNLAYEMNVRNSLERGRYFGTQETSTIHTYYGRTYASHRYQLETAYTQTDYAINQLEQSQDSQALRKLLRQLHPDRRLGTQLEPIALYCTQETNALKQAINKLLQQWSTGQWAAKPALPQEEDAPWTHESITRAYEPKEKLDLSSLALHQNYINWATARTTWHKKITKESREVNWVKTFFYRADEDDKSQSLRQMLAGLQAMIVNQPAVIEANKKLEQELPKLLEKCEQSEAELLIATQEKEAAQQAKEVAQKENEAAQQVAETERLANEAAQQVAETERLANEAAQQVAETERLANEAAQKALLATKFRQEKACKLLLSKKIKKLFNCNDYAASKTKFQANLKNVIEKVNVYYEEFSAEELEEKALIVLKEINSDCWRQLQIPEDKAPQEPGTK